MSGLIGLEIHVADGWVEGILYKAQPPMVHLGYQGLELVRFIRRVLPDCFIIGRPDFGDSPKIGDTDVQAEELGIQAADQAISLHLHGCICDAWTGYCEAQVGNNHARYAILELARTRRLHRVSLKSVVGNWNVGSVEVEDSLLYRKLMEEADYVGPHCYGSDPKKEGGTNMMADQSQYYSLRFKTWVEAYRQRGWRFPPVVATEAGTYYGWQGSDDWPPKINEETYLEDIKRMAQECSKLDYMGGFPLFCIDPSWGKGFDLSSVSDNFWREIAKWNHSWPTDWRKLKNASEEGGIPMAEFTAQDREQLWAAHEANIGAMPMFMKVRLMHPALGEPLGPEIDMKGCRFQEFVGGFIFADLAEVARVGWEQATKVAYQKEELPPLA